MVLKRDKEPTAVPPINNTPYILAIIVMIAICFAAVVVLQIMLPDSDNMPVILLIIGFLTPTTVSLLAFMKAQETHSSVNSRLDQFIKHAQDASLAQGRAEGLQQGVEQANLRTDKLDQAEP